jgi:hypothetical protein
MNQSNATTLFGVPANQSPRTVKKRHWALLFLGIVISSAISLIADEMRCDSSGCSLSSAMGSAIWVVRLFF